MPSVVCILKQLLLSLLLRSSSARLMGSGQNLQDLSTAGSSCGHNGGKAPKPFDTLLLCQASPYPPSSLLGVNPVAIQLASYPDMARKEES